MTFDKERFAKLSAELNMLAPENAATFSAIAAETAVLRVLNEYEIPEDVFWSTKLKVLENVISALKESPRL